MMAVGWCDSSTGERSDSEVRVKDGMECEARASSVIRNSSNGQRQDSGGQNAHYSPIPSFISNSTFDSRVRPVRLRPVPRDLIRSES